MERLTERDEFGNANILGVDSMDLQCNLGFEKFNRVTKALNKLAEYEELEEQNKLPKLPCAVGDIVYAVRFGDIEVHKVATIEIEKSGIYFKSEPDRPFCELGNFGKIAFLTREEAEAVLEAQ